MTGHISIPALRGAVALTAEEVDALVEAVEAAEELDRQCGPMGDDPIPASDEWLKLRATLARFDFGEDR